MLERINSNLPAGLDKFGTCLYHTPTMHTRQHRVIQHNLHLAFLKPYNLYYSSAPVFKSTGLKHQKNLFMDLLINDRHTCKFQENSKIIFYGPGL